jgi:membrane protein DedA with SNARE-associated domain/membrane-associated phospholipid phosphatase
MHDLHALLALIGLHPGPAYAAVFLASFGESLALVGLIVPGAMIMFGAGAVVAMGSLGLKPVILLAAVGAVAGDGLSFWLGRTYQDKLRRIWPFSRFPDMLKKGEAFFLSHGGKSVLLGRFVGPVRPVIPVVAGMLGMRPLHFGIVNVLSAIGWAFAYILPGVFFGTSLAVAGAVSTRLAMLLFLILAIIWAFVWLVRLIARWISHRGPGWIAALKMWVAADNSAPGIGLYLKRPLSFLFRHRHGDEMLFAGLVIALLVAGWGFLGVLQDVLARDPLVYADRSIYHLFQSLRTPWGDRIFVALTEFGDFFVNIRIFAGILLVLLAKRCYRTAGYWVVVVLGGLAGIQLLKWTIHLPQPSALYPGMWDYGFPSSHTTMCMILYGFLAIIVFRGLVGAWRWGIFVAVLLYFFIIAVSRLYLGAHWLSDILGGFFIGTAWITLLGIAYLKEANESVPRRWLGIVTVLTLVTAGSWHVFHRFDTDIAIYVPRENMRYLRLDAWLKKGWRTLPPWRIDMAGEREQPLTVQWAGPPDALVRYLSNRGWRPPPPLDVRNFLGMLSPDTPMKRLPVLPHLHSGRAALLCLVHEDGSQRWVLRLWPADFGIDGSQEPLLVGTMEVQKPYHLTWLITVAGDTRDYDRGPQVLARILQQGFALRCVERSAETVLVKHNHKRLHWQGKVLLVWKSQPADFQR